MTSTHSLHRFAVVPILMAIAGCAAASLGPLPVGIETSNTRIVATDGSWELMSGRIDDLPFVTPHQALGYGDARPVDNDDDLAANPEGEAVLVYAEGLDDPLHGRLALYPIVETGIGPATQSYSLIVPRDRVAQAQRGLTAVVFETYQNEPRTFSVDTATRMYAWILWLSTQPIEG